MYYFDNAATTKVDPEITKIINKYNEEKYFNPSSLSSFSLDVARDIASARKRIANALSCDADEILFTSGGTESDNTAIFCALHNKKGNIITTMAEHSAVHKCMNALKNKDYEIRYAELNPDGSVNADSMASLIDAETLLVAIMHINNETGAINDIAKLVKITKSKNQKTLFFSDGTQGVAKINVGLHSLGVDLYAFSGHKFHAPKGVGALYIKKGVSVLPFHYGGGQESGLRSGTENVSGIIAMSYALEKAVALIDENTAKFNEFKRVLLNAYDTLGDFKLLASGSAAILCAAFSGIKSQILSNILEQDGIVIGLGSACSAKNKQNRIMTAVGLDRKYIEGVTRISFSRFTTIEEVNFLAEKMVQNVTMLRKLTK